MLRIGLVLLVSTFVCFGKDQTSLDVPMLQTFGALMNLQPFAVSPERFAEPASREVISRDLAVLATLRHQIPKDALKNDPAMGPILGVFASYAGEMESEFKHGRTEYVRHRVHTLTNFCLACHTRVSTSSDFEDLGARVNALKITPFQKADFYAATRQFDKALASYKLLLDEKPKDGLAVLEYTRALRRALSIGVRVKQDPKWTLDLLTRLANRKDLPVFDQDFIRSWKKDAEAWNKDIVVSSDLTGEALVRKAQKLVERAEGLQSFSSDENGDVSYLRASGYFNEALQRDPKAAYRGEALYGLGVTYRVLQEPYLWELDALYFEACIREVPHSVTAGKCFRRFSEGLMRESSDAAPGEADLRRLEELRKLAR